MYREFDGPTTLRRIQSAPLQAQNWALDANIHIQPDGRGEPRAYQRCGIIGAALLSQSTLPSQQAPIDQGCSCGTRFGELPQDFRTLDSLKNWRHEQTESVFAGCARASRGLGGRALQHGDLLGTRIRRRGLRAPPLRQAGELSSAARRAPRGQVRRIQAFAPEQRADLAGRPTALDVEKRTRRHPQSASDAYHLGGSTNVSCERDAQRERCACLRNVKELDARTGDKYGFAPSNKEQGKSFEDSGYHHARPQDRKDF
ncbi:MAG: hypothetical protein ACRENQ_14115 [Gemmatimonadaceae bacterium]